MTKSNVIGEYKCIVENVESNGYFPKFIQQELNVLKFMLLDQEYYGALLQCKDVFELLLKVPCIILLERSETTARSAEDVSERTPNMNKLREIINHITSHASSFGDWEELGKFYFRNKKVLNFTHLIDLQCLKILEIIVPKYLNFSYNGKKGKISSFRNDYIGHGAINSDKESVKNDLEAYALPVLNSIIKNVGALFGYLTFIENKDNLSIEYNAANESRNCVGVGTEKRIMDPYFNVAEYMFESFNHSKGTSFMLNYSSGKKVESLELYRRFELLRRKFAITFSSDENVGNVILEKDENSISKIINSKYVSNTYFLEKIKDWVHLNDKGIFLLETPRGTGKTVFCSMLEDKPSLLACSETDFKRYNDRNLMLSDEEDVEYICWCFHVNEFFGAKKSSFITKLNKFGLKNVSDSGEQFLNNMGEFNRSYLNNSCDIDEEDENFKFNSFLEDIYHIYQEEYWDKKLKLIILIDGIDELNEEQSANMNLEKLVDLNSLSENIYIIFTSRNSEELSDIDIFRRIGNREISSSVKLSLDDDAYVQILKSRIINPIGPNNKPLFPKAFFDQVLSWANNRFIYITFLRDLYDIDKEKYFEIATAINEGQNPKLISEYLKVIEKYSKKYAVEIKRLLIILATVNEPLTATELMYFYNEDYTFTYRFIGLLNDISTFLHIERDGKRGSLYKLSNKIWTEEILNAFDENVTEFKNEMNQRIESVLARDWKSLNPSVQEGMLINDLFSCFLTEDFLKKHKNQLYVFNEIYNKIVLRGHSLEQAIKVMDCLDIDGESDNWHIFCSLTKVMLLASLGKYNDALRYGLILEDLVDDLSGKMMASSIAAIISKTKKSGDLNSISHYQNLVYKELSNIYYALGNYDKAWTYLDLSGNAGAETVVSFLRKQCLILCRLKNKDELKDVANRLLKISGEDDAETVAFARDMLHNYYLYLGDRDKAYDNLKMAKSVLERKRKKLSIQGKSDLAGIYFDLAMLSIFDKSDYFEKSIKILEDLMKSKCDDYTELMLSHQLGPAYLEYAKILRNSNIDKAVLYSGKAVTLMERLQKKGLSISLCNFAVCKYTHSELEYQASKQSLKDITRLHECIQKDIELFKEGAKELDNRIVDYPELANMYKLSSNLKLKLNDYLGAIEDAKEAVGLFEKETCLDCDKTSDMLACTYIDGLLFLVSLYYKNNQIEDAKTVFGKAKDKYYSYISEGTFADSDNTIKYFIDILENELSNGMS